MRVGGTRHERTTHVDGVAVGDDANALALAGGAPSRRRDGAGRPTRLGHKLPGDVIRLFAGERRSLEILEEGRAAEG